MTVVLLHIVLGQSMLSVYYDAVILLTYLKLPVKNLINTRNKGNKVRRRSTNMDCLFWLADVANIMSVFGQIRLVVKLNTVITLSLIHI